MATVYREFIADVPAATAWAAISDVGSVHKKLAVGFVTNVLLQGSVRTVTFANGFTVQEEIIAVDEEHKRLAYTAVGGRASHHNASFQVFDIDENQCRIEWITDLLPDDVAGTITAMVDQGIIAIKNTLKK
jgi:hypothetical protein